MKRVDTSKVDPKILADIREMTGLKLEDNYTEDELLTLYLRYVCDIVKVDHILAAIANIHEAAKENQYIIHWLSGPDTEISGYDQADAFRKAGIGAGAIPAVDWVEEVK
jgi:hypothetical protein